MPPFRKQHTFEVRATWGYLVHDYRVQYIVDIPSSLAIFRKDGNEERFCNADETIEVIKQNPNASGSVIWKGAIKERIERKMFEKYVRRQKELNNGK